jgi:hypothetical protein
MVDTVSIEEMKKSALEFITQVSLGDYAGTIVKFDGDLKKALSPEKLQALVQQLTMQAGAMIKVDGVSTSEVHGYTVVSVTCQFAKAYIDILIPFNGQGLMSGLSFKPSTPLASEYRPPAYVDPRSFSETAVTVGIGEWALPGTLSIPEGAGPFPGIVLVHGSGPNDRDETIGPNKVFRDLAWGLSTRGIAVLRYDKRTMAHKSKYTPYLAPKITVKDEVIDDALLAVRLLGENTKVDSKRLFILGHSLGGMLLPWIGSQATGLAGMIIMAGSSRPLEDSILDQFTYLYSLSGPMSEQQRSDMETLKVQVARAKSPELSENTPRKDLPIGMWPTYILSMRDYKPVDVARSLPMPMLLLQGGRDYQVMPTKDFEAWKAGLQDRAKVTFRLFPELNHLMIEGKGPCRPEEYAIEGHMSEEVVNAIAVWVKGLRT